MIASFLARNMSYSVQNVRSLPSVIKAMREYDKENPRCHYCGRIGDTDVHHIQPVHIRPALAADKKNMVVLCRKKKCHFVVGHGGDWKHYNAIVEETCKNKIIIGGT